jgi:DNA-binding MarR family transcriptional regulator
MRGSSRRWYKGEMGNALRQRIQQERFESPLQEAILNLLVAADSVRDLFDHACVELGITASQYNVLRILRGIHPEGHPRCEIARRMVERAPDVTRLIDRLEKQGLVARDRSESDRRLSISRITPAGLELLDRMEPRLRAVHEHIAGRLSPGDRHELSRICEGIYEEAEGGASSSSPNRDGLWKSAGATSVGDQAVNSGGSPAGRSIR